MIRKLFTLMVSVLYSATVFCQSDTKELEEKLEAARYHYYILQQSDAPVTLANEAYIDATKKDMVDKAAEALYWKAFFVFGVGLPHARETVSEALVYSRKHKVKSAEADLLILLSRMMQGKKDSAFLLLDQALAIAVTNKLAEQEASALAYKGILYINDQPDSARLLFSKAKNIVHTTAPSVRHTSIQINIARAWAKQPDTAIYLMKQALHSTRQNNRAMDEIRVLANFMSTQTVFFLRDSLDAFYARTLSLCRQEKFDSIGIMTQYIQSSQDIGNFTTALKTGLQLLRIAEKKKDRSQLQQILYGLGLSYEYTFDYKKAIECLNRAKEYRDADAFTYVFTLDDLARCHLNIGNKDSAKYYAAASYKEATKFYEGEEFIYGGVLNDLGIIYFDLGEDSLALNYLRRSYHDFTINMAQNKNFALTTGALAKYFDKHGPPDSAFYYAKQSLKVSVDGGFLDNLTAASSLISKYYFNKKNLDSAYRYQLIGFEAYKELYNYENGREFQNLSNAEQQREEEVAQAERMAEQRYKSNLRFYGMLAALIAAIVIGSIIYRNNRQRIKSYDLLKKQKQEIDIQKSKLEDSLNDLNTTQIQLIQSEKMASLGELTAGIAHEIQNPLNFVNNFSEVSNELVDEMKEELSKGNYSGANAIAENVKQNLEKINHHGKRADAIVKGMLQHSRSSSGVKELTDINSLCDEYLRLSYHGLRAKDKSFNAAIKTDFDNNIGKINVLTQDLGRVILNLLTNAFYAVNEKKQKSTGGYEPTVMISTKKTADKVEISISDNGNGIPKRVLDKIFQPFFTTKPPGEGTGLGLSLSYDIITKGHGGKLEVETKENEGSAFKIKIPIN